MRRACLNLHIYYWIRYKYICVNLRRMSRVILLVLCILKYCHICYCALIFQICLKQCNVLWIQCSGRMESAMTWLTMHSLCTIKPLHSMQMPFLRWTLRWITLFKISRAYDFIFINIVLTKILNILYVWQHVQKWALDSEGVCNVK